MMGLEAKTFSSTLASLADPLTVAKYLMAYLAETVFPAPDSPLTMIDWFLSSLKHKHKLIPSCSLKDIYLLHPQLGNNPSTTNVSSTAKVSAGGRHKAVSYQLPARLAGLPASRMLLQDGPAVTVQPASRAALEILWQRICYSAIHYMLLQLLLSRVLWDSAPLNYQWSLVKIMNAILQREKSTAEAATETFRPSALITSLSQNCSGSEKFKHGWSGHR